MLATPSARESFQEDWSQRATPRFPRIAQASSTTRRIRLRRPARTACCNHAAAQAMSTPRAGEW